MNNFQFSIFNLQKKRGFALLIAVIFMSVMLSFGLALGSISYKQQVLASDAVESQYAFYAADAALECALYADQGQAESLFSYPTPTAPASAPVITCDGALATFPPAFPTGIVSYTTSPAQWIITERVSIDSALAHPRCADITIYKPAPGTGTTYIFAQGYDVPCSVVAAPSGARFVSRGEDARY